MSSTRRNALIYFVAASLPAERPAVRSAEAEKDQAAQGQNNDHEGEDNKQREEYAAEIGIEPGRARGRIRDLRSGHFHKLFGSRVFHALTPYKEAVGVDAQRRAGDERTVIMLPFDQKTGGILGQYGEKLL